MRVYLEIYVATTNELIDHNTSVSHTSTEWITDDMIGRTDIRFGEVHLGVVVGEPRNGRVQSSYVPHEELSYVAFRLKVSLSCEVQGCMGQGVKGCRVKGCRVKWCRDQVM